MREPALRVALDAGYGKRTVLTGVQFDLQPGERLGVVGSSGAGKSTLTLALLGLLPWRRGWAKGEVVLDGRNLLTLKEKDARALRGKQIALVPQSAMTSLNHSLSLQAHFEEAWRAHEKPSAPHLQTRIGQLLPQLRLPSDSDFLHSRPGEISVGQAQRICLALALLHRPAVLLADEPTSALDPITQAEILTLLRAAGTEDDTALLYVSHDLVSVLRLCDRLAVMDAGRIVEQLAVADVAHATHAVTRELLQSLPAPPEVITRYRSATSSD